MAELKTLTIKDFKVKEVEGFTSYLGFDFDGKEICIEPCMNGYCVGIYKDQELLEDKQCTNLKPPFGMTMPTEFPLYIEKGAKFIEKAQTRALKFANNFYIKHQANEMVSSSEE